MALIQLVALILATVTAIQGHAFQGFASWATHPCCGRVISARNGSWLALGGSTDNLIYTYDGTTYKQLTGSAQNTAASPDGWHWIRGMNNLLFRWNKTNSQWELQQPSDNTEQVSAASKDTIMVLKQDNSIQYCPNGVSSCNTMPGRASWVGIGSNDERWMIGYPDKTIWRWNNAAQQWDKMPGENGKRIDVRGPNAVALVTVNNTVFLWENCNWSPIQGSNCEWASLDDGKMWCIYPPHNLYYGEFLGKYPESTSSSCFGSSSGSGSGTGTGSGGYPGPDMQAALASGKCQITCPYIPAAPSTGTCGD